jgi:hypothetical protein
MCRYFFGRRKKIVKSASIRSDYHRNKIVVNGINNTWSLKEQGLWRDRGCVIVNMYLKVAVNLQGKFWTNFIKLWQSMAK